MTRARTSFQCCECGAQSPRWVGRCPGCGQWNTIEEAAPPPVSGLTADAGPPPAQLMTIDAAANAPVPTGLSELDRVLGGGLVRSSVTLLAGEPGIGKSTLLLQMLAGLAARGQTALLVSAEETAAQVRRRSARIGPPSPDVWITSETELGRICTAIDQLAPDVVVVDSVQTIASSQIGSTAGTVAQVRACAQALAETARADGPAVILVGHVTKDGSIAGPRVLEHLVDTVLWFEGDRHHAVRLLRAVKHRFGPVGELGMWEMGEQGLVEVADPARLLLADRCSGIPGTVVFAAMEGRRPLLVEVQALVVPAPEGSAPRRSASGYEAGRLAQLLAVLDRRAGVLLGRMDVYVSAVGGVRLADPGADLAVALAVTSAATGREVSDDLVVLGEVGLAGELRRVANTGERLTEASRMGFVRAITPPGAQRPPGRLEAQRSGGGRAGGTPGRECELLAAFEVEVVPTLFEALELGLGEPAATPRLRVVPAG